MSKPYPEYKDSGIETIGNLPSIWQLVRLKYLSDKIIDGTHSTPEYDDNGVPFLRVTDIQTHEINLDKVTLVSD